MVKAIPSGKSARFIDKKAEMFLKKSSKVQLVVSDEFPGFHFTSIPVDVSYNTKLVADCSNSERLDNIFESLKINLTKMLINLFYISCLTKYILLNYLKRYKHKFFLNYLQLKWPHS